MKCFHHSALSSQCACSGKHPRFFRTTSGSSGSLVALSRVTSGEFASWSSASFATPPGGSARASICDGKRSARTTCGAVLHRPTGSAGPPTGGSSSTELLIQRLGRCGSLEEVLKLVEQRGQVQAVGQSAYQVELLAALARVLRTATEPGADKKGKAVMNVGDAQSARALLPSLLKDLATRSGLLSFKQLSSALASLAVLTRALRLAPLPEAAALVASLPVAARNTFPQPPPSALMEAFSAALQMYRLPGAAPAGSQQDGAMMAPPVALQLREYLTGALVGGAGLQLQPQAQVQPAGQPRGDGDMAELAAAVALVRLYFLPQSPAWVAAVAARVEDLVREATPAAAAAPSGGKPKGGAGDGQGRQSGQDAPPKGPGTPGGADGSRHSQAAAGKRQRKERRDKADVATAGQWDGAAGPVATDSGAEGKSSKVQPGPQAQQQSPKPQPAKNQSGVISDATGHAKELDVRSLEMLLSAWFSAPPPQQQTPTPTPTSGSDSAAGPSSQGPGDPGVSAAFDWPAWASRVLEQLWLTQDPTTREQRGALLAEREGLAKRLKELKRALDAAKQMVQAEGVGGAQAGNSGGGRVGSTERGGGGGRSGGRGDGGGGGGRGKKGKGDKDKGAVASAIAEPQPEAGTSAPATAAAAPGKKVPGAERADPGSSAKQAQTRAAELAAQVSGLSAKLTGVARQLSGLGPSAGAVLDDEAVVRLAFSSARCLGDRCGPRVGELAEQVLSSRLGSMAQHPQRIIWSLSALRRMRHPCRPAVLASALQHLVPHLRGLATPDAMELLEALQAFSPAPPSSPPPRDILLPLGKPLVGASGSYWGADSSMAMEYAMALLPLSSAWGVPLAEETLAAVGRLAERRVRLEVDESRSPGLFRSLSESKRYMVETAEVTIARNSLPSGPISNGPCGFMERLLERVVLPLCELRQRFDNYEVFMAVLNCWLDRGLAGVTARKATLMLGMVAAAPSWPHVPMLRKDLESLMVAVLREEWLLEQGLSAKELAALLLAAAQALRVMAGKVLRSGSIAEDAAPRAAPLLLPAVECLLALQPGPEQLAVAMKALFVELEWDPRLAAATQQAVATSSGISGSKDLGKPVAVPPAQRPPPHLLERMMALAEASLQPQPLGTAAGRPEGGRKAGGRAAGRSGGGGGGCSAEAAAFMLEACARWDHLPPPGLLDKVYGAALTSVRARAPQAAVVVSLADSISRLDALAVAAAAVAAAAASAAVWGAAETPDDGAPLPAATTSADVTDDEGAGGLLASPTRAALLEALATGLTQDEALRLLSKTPGKLVGAVRQLALMGVRPAAAWVESYYRLVQGLMGGLTAQSLAHAAAGLALLGASPPDSWVDSLLVEAEKRVAPVVGGGGGGGTGVAGGGAVSSSWQRFDLYDLGLLLGAVHALWGRGRKLSDAAEAAWGRAHGTFVNGALGIMSRYRAVELQLVVAAVAAYELRRPFLGGASAGGGLRTVDLTGRVELDWLEACGGALLAGRRRRLRSAGPGASSVAAAAELPGALLLMDLLRLASKKVHSSRDGRIRRLNQTAPTTSGSGNSGASSSGGSAGGAESLSAELQVVGLLRYVGLSLADWAAVGRQEGGGGGGGGGGGSPAGLSVADWADLLAGSLDAGIVPPAAALEVYCGQLFPALLLSVQQPAAEQQQQQPLTPGAEGRGRGVCSAAAALDKEPEPSEQRLLAVWAATESALVRVLLRALPWSPPQPLAVAVSDGFLAAVPLGMATLRQLGLLSTFCIQTGLGDPLFWRRLRSEAVCRATLWLQLLEPRNGAPAADIAPGGSADDLRSLAVPVADAVAAADLTAVLYGLEVSGCGCGVARSPEEALLAEWLVRLSDTAAPAARAKSLAGMGPSLAALACLQALWVERCLQGCPVLQASGLAAFDSPETVQLLLPAQLKQLVWLCEDASAAVGASSPPLQREVAAALVRQLVRSPGGLEPGVAAVAMSCVVPPPRYTSSAEGAEPLSRDAVVLAKAAEPGLLGMRLDRLAELLEAAGGRPGWRLTLHRLERIVERLRAEVQVEVDVEVGDAVPVGRLEAGAGAAAACRWSVGRCLRVARSLLLLGVAPQHGGPDVSAGERREVLAAVAPWLALLFPDAEERVRAQALVDRLGRTVCAAGAAAAENVDLQYRKEAGFPVLLQSARAASETVAAATCVLLERVLHPDPNSVPDLSHSNTAKGTAVASAGAGLDAGSGSAAATSEPIAPLAAAMAAVLPREAAAGLLDALIAAGGNEPLPRPLAAVALQLLGLDGVAAAVPVSRLDQAVRYSLRGEGGREPLPMSDVVVAAVEPRLKLRGSMSGALRQISLARELRLSGASPVVSHRAIVTHWRLEDTVGCPMDDLAFLLGEMYESGMAEPGLGMALLSHRSYVADVYNYAVTMAAIDANLRTHKDLPSTLEVLRFLWLLKPRIASPFNLPGVTQLVRNTGALPAPGAPLLKPRDMLPEPALLWRLLDVLGCHGPHEVSRAYMKQMLVKYVRLISGLKASKGDTLPCPIPEMLTSYAEVERLDVTRGVTNVGAYTMDSVEAAAVASRLWPSVQAHAAAAAAAAAAPAAAARKRAGGTAGGGFNGLTGSSEGGEGGQMLTCRQLGLFFGLVALRPKSKEEGPEEDELKRFRNESWPLYLASLRRLVARTDLAPLERLQAACDAMEPVLCANPQGKLFPEVYTAAGGIVDQLIDVIVNLIVPVLRSDQPLLDDPDSDSWVGILAIRACLGSSLDNDLYWPDGSRGRLQLPETLQPIIGQRHGWGDPEGDAAREEYLREVLPWYVVTGRLFGITMDDVNGRLYRRLAACGITGPGGGKWADLLWQVVVVPGQFGGEVEEMTERVLGVMEMVGAVEGAAQKLRELGSGWLSSLGRLLNSQKSA